MERLNDAGVVEVEMYVKCASIRGRVRVSRVLGVDSLALSFGLLGNGKSVVGTN